MDTILYNAKITTMNSACPFAEAVAIENGTVAAVGSNEDILSLRTEDTVCTDMSGAAVYPGFTDTHLHLLDWAIDSHKLALNDYPSKKKMLEAIRAYAAQFPEGSIIDGSGFNEDNWEEKCLPTLEEMDEACPGRGLRLTRICGHMRLANRFLMDRMGVTPETPVPEGGSMDYKRGIFCENALGLISIRDAQGTLEQCKELLYEGMCHAAKTGLTSVYSDDFGFGSFDMHTVIRAYRELDREGRMPVRVVQQCRLTDDGMLKEFLAAGYTYGQNTGRFTLGPRKLFIDGSLGARTALLSVPYCDDPETKGVAVCSQEELDQLARSSHEAGMPFIVHAIGDTGAEMVLDAIEYARRSVPGTENLQDGIVHCQITTPHTLKRIIELHAAVYAQPVFCEYDLHICRDRVGAELEKTSYNWKTLYRAGVCISSGSDCPVEPLDPAKNIYCAVNRRDFRLQPESAWLPEQCLTVAEAIACHTVQAARAVGMEDRFGKIESGFFADFSVFPVPFEELSPEEMLAAKPSGTMVGGLWTEI